MHLEATGRPKQQTPGPKQRPIWRPAARQQMDESPSAKSAEGEDPPTLQTQSRGAGKISRNAQKKA